jgi:hypothetical protein
MKVVNITRNIVMSKNDLELFDRKILVATKGLQPYVLNYFKTMVGTNATILAEYIIAARSEFNISNNYRKETIKDPFTLSKFFNHEKSFKEMFKKTFYYTLLV